MEERGREDVDVVLSLTYPGVCDCEDDVTVLAVREPSSSFSLSSCLASPPSSTSWIALMALVAHVLTPTTLG